MGTVKIWHDKWYIIRAAWDPYIMTPNFLLNSLSYHVYTEVILDYFKFKEEDFP